jgi:ketosteroid isomerase-like protein
LNEWLAVWDDYELRVDDVFAAPDGRAVSLIHQRGKGRESGLPLDMKSAQIATIRDGKVTRLENYDDRARALEAVGQRE